MGVIATLRTSKQTSYHPRRVLFFFFFFFFFFHTTHLRFPPQPIHGRIWERHSKEGCLLCCNKLFRMLHFMQHVTTRRQFILICAICQAPTCWRVHTCTQRSSVHKGISPITCILIT